MPVKPVTFAESRRAEAMSCLGSARLFCVWCCGSFLDPHPSPVLFARVFLLKDSPTPYETPVCSNECARRYRQSIPGLWFAERLQIVYEVHRWP